jgi:hypothetical protein
MLVLEYWGEHLTSQKIVPGNVAIGTLPNCYYYTEWTVAFTSGGNTTETKVGDWIVGATSGVVSQVVSITATGTSWAAGDMVGTMRLRSKFHPVAGTTNWTSGENWKVGAGTNDGTFTLLPTIAPASDLYAFPKGSPAKCALVSVLTNTVLVDYGGGTPDQTSLVGLPMKDGSSILLLNIGDISRFKVIDYVASSAGVVNIQYFF